MKKNKLLLFVFLLTAFLCYVLPPNYKLGGFYGFSEWGGYLFAVPIAYGFLSIIFPKIQSKYRVKSLMWITLGAFIAIILSRNSETATIILKMSSCLLGSVIAYILYRPKKIA